MSYQDKICVCRDCGVEFSFTAESQADYERRGFKDPTRCTDCRKKRSPRRKAKAAATTESPQRETVSAPSFGHFGLDARLERAIRAAGFETPTPGPECHYSAWDERA